MDTVQAKLLDAARRHADSLGSRAVADVHLLMAVLSESDANLRSLLASVGLTLEAAQGAHSRLLTASADVSSDETVERPIAPIVWMALGRAEGIALTLHAPVATEALVLIAVAWEPETQTRAILKDLGVDVGAVHSTLTAAGELPVDIQLPHAPRSDWGRPAIVDVSSLDDILEMARATLPADVRVVHSRVSDRSVRVVASHGADLDSLIRAMDRE